MVYLSILRGINVGGKNLIKMTELKSMFTNLGFNNVSTYIQSGNVIFESNERSELANTIEKAIKKEFNIQVPVIIRSKEELQKVANNNPFLRRAGVAVDKLHITFLSEAVNDVKSESINTADYAPDDFQIINKEVYVHCPNGYGKTKLNNTFFEKILAVPCTTRNWKTTNKLLELMKAYS